MKRKLTRDKQLPTNTNLKIEKNINRVHSIFLHKEGCTIIKKRMIAMKVKGRAKIIDTNKYKSITNNVRIL